MALFNKSRLNELEARANSISIKQTILVVDDEAANRQAIIALLRPNYRLLEACDGQEALDLVLKVEDPDNLVAIISDQRMPRLTGVQLFERLLPVLPRIIRIIVTGFIDVDAIVDSINRAKIDKFIIKPFDPREFIQSVDQAVATFENRKTRDAHHAGLKAALATRTEELAQALRDLEACRAP